jgi:hypothetical protein
LLRAADGLALPGTVDLGRAAQSASSKLINASVDLNL